MNFKNQIAEDMKVFHNTSEFGNMTHIWYQEKMYTVPLIIDHTSAEKRRQLNGDNAEGLYTADCLVYISQHDLGFVPKRGRKLEMDEAGNGTALMYMIDKADVEDGEIILELSVIDE